MPISGKVSDSRGRYDPFLLKVVVMVDEATEPGISDQEVETRRVELVNIVQERKFEQMGVPAPITPITGGEAVAFALRKRLKSEDEVAVLNTLSLLDELMRTCPYFYRFIATEKFFRRLWRFVVPDYKNGVKSMIPIFGKPKVHAGMRTGSAVSSRVRILIRAWAEELSVMFHGRYDPDAGFLIERYNNKRGRINFPEVPKTPLPWVCPIDSSAGDYLRGSSSRRGSSSTGSGAKEAMSLAEVENTVNLFANLIENASSISDLKGELCQELADRCKFIHTNLSRLSMNMSKEEELSRAIAVSETLEKALGQYKGSLESGRLVRTIPTVDTISLQSEDEGYGDSDRSLERYRTNSDTRQREQEYQNERYSDSSEASHERRDDWRAREREADRGRDLRRNGERDSGRRGERGLERGGEREDERDEVSYRSRDMDNRDSPPPIVRVRTMLEKNRVSSPGTEKRSRRDLPPKAALRRRQKSESDVALLKAKKKSGASASKRAPGLIDIPEEDQDSDSNENQANDESFAMLAERYATHKISRKKPSSKPGPSGSASSRPPTQPTDDVPPVPAASNSGAYYNSTTPGMPFNSMLMMNPYAMYSSVPHVPMDPMAMYNSYSSMNPAMYYATVNPQMYSSVPMPGMLPPVAMTPTPQSPVRQDSAAAPTAPPPQTRAAAPGRVTPPLSAVSPQQGAQPAMPMGMGSFYGSVGGAPMMGGGIPVMMGAGEGTQGQQGVEAQAAVYQSAMQQAAAAYHSAAHAYRSISGQAPVERGGGVGPPASGTGGVGRRENE